MVFGVALHKQHGRFLGIPHSFKEFSFVMREAASPSLQPMARSRTPRRRRIARLLRITRPRNRFTRRAAGQLRPGKTRRVRAI